MTNPRNNNIKTFIYILSVAIPLVVGLLFRVKIEGLDFSFLPPIYASINAFTSFILVLAIIAIKGRKKELHKKLINFALFLSAVFLLLYVAYHVTSEPTMYEGNYKYIYYFILISHIALSVVVIPFVLFTYLFAVEGNFEKHKNWAKKIWPLWFYVAVSGVVVYWMISPFYK